jgi:hypothetical protein
MLEIKDGRIQITLNMDLDEYERIILNPVEELICKIKKSQCCAQCDSLREETIGYINKSRSIFINR